MPVVGEPLGSVDKYSGDRLFVSISIGEPSNEAKSHLSALANAGHPIVYREFNDIYDLGAEFFVWEFATAFAGWRIGINPFDQPNVQESKDATRELLNTFVSHGQLPEQHELIADDAIAVFGDMKDDLLPTASILELLRAFLSKVNAGDYLALLNYVEETPDIEAELVKIRSTLRDATRCATTTGYGPRFLHSTGQLHKGGPPTGVFFQITANDATDFAVPGEAYTFSILKQAQALGDFNSLLKRGRRAIRVDLGNDTVSGLKRLLVLVSEAVPPKPEAVGA